MNIPKLIKGKRLELKESQKQFATRFDVSHAAVSDWENGKSEAPYKVLEFCMSVVYINCPYCKGTGQISIYAK